mmetsp:Transcript_53669/g.59948  ORF Transcript_53669/g.59948 Transcript_53669/m.59948 type:complete len:93 (-) Transcript_53669:80-358(-)
MEGSIITTLSTTSMEGSMKTTTTIGRHIDIDENETISSLGGSSLGENSDENNRDDNSFLEKTSKKISMIIIIRTKQTRVIIHLMRSAATTNL